jgi:hypothetical protein
MNVLKLNNMENKYYSYNNGDYVDENILEVVQYMVDDDLCMDDIIGKTLDICEKTNVYSDKDYLKVQEIIYSEADIFDDDYFQRERVEIMNKIESMKYFDTVGKYTITPEDWNDFMGGLILREKEIKRR